MQEVLTVFARDSTVASKLKCVFALSHPCHTSRSLAYRFAPLPCHNSSKDTPSSNSAPDPSSNGVVPMRGHVLLVAPLAYTSNSTAKVYTLFKALYLRFWWRLSTVSSHPEARLFPAALN